MASRGAQRFLDLVRRYGRDTVNGACEDLMDYSERLMRGAIRDIHFYKQSNTSLGVH